MPSHGDLSSFLSSPHPAVATHTAASLTRLAAARADLIPPDLALLLPLAPLSASASPSPRLASCLIKVVAALASCVLRFGPTGSRFPPHNHPFVQRSRQGLTRQVARMVTEGVDGVVKFLRPFVKFAVVRKGDATFVRDLIAALAAMTAATVNPDSAIPC